MNYVIAVIQPNKLEAVRETLSKAGIPGMTVSDAQGFGRQRGHSEVYRGHEYTVNFVRKIKIEIACDESATQDVVSAIAAGAKDGGGKTGDGKIFVLQLEEAIRIRTDERGVLAL